MNYQNKYICRVNLNRSKLLAKSFLAIYSIAILSFLFAGYSSNSKSITPNAKETSISKLSSNFSSVTNAGKASYSVENLVQSESKTAFHYFEGVNSIFEVLGFSKVKNYNLGWSNWLIHIRKINSLFPFHHFW